MCRCLYCYRPLKAGEVDYHPACAKAFFGTETAPLLDYTMEALDDLAGQVIQAQTTLTGVQPKLSLHIQRHNTEVDKLTIVGLWGNYILKPQTERFPQLPEVEDVTMKMADIFGIKTVPHCLIRMADGTLCYITKRIDRTDEGQKIAMEDMCQLSERKTEDKDKSSYERIGKVIDQYSSLPMMDKANFAELVAFCWLTGNNDMHLKNFSLYSPDGETQRLAPAYDLLNAAIVNPADDEEMSLTINGRKKRLKQSDFLSFAKTIGLPEKTILNIFKRLKKFATMFEALIKESFLSQDLQSAYINMISERLQRISKDEHHNQN